MAETGVGEVFEMLLLVESTTRLAGVFSISKSVAETGVGVVFEMLLLDDSTTRLQGVFSISREVDGADLTAALANPQSRDPALFILMEVEEENEEEEKVI